MFGKDKNLGESVLELRRILRSINSTSLKPLMSCTACLGNPKFILLFVRLWANMANAVNTLDHSPWEPLVFLTIEKCKVPQEGQKPCCLTHVILQLPDGKRIGEVLS